MKYLWYLTKDYTLGFKTLIHTQIYRKDSPVFIGSSFTKNPIILIPGVLQRWNVFRKIIPQLNKKGYPVYTVTNLKRNTILVKDAANLVRKVIDENKLKNVILLGHSKGGLIGKYVLAFYNKDNRVKKLIALATPFNGSEMAKKFPSKITKEFLPNSVLIDQLKQWDDVNNKITSIYSKWDQSVKPLESSILQGAKNIEVDSIGHHSIVFSKETENIILSELS